ncbi:MAG TPA: hypothetical protein VMF58_15620 [Rhizomicrobium sp.]|nr:hypothetical protein [Rhizomicrobium sp.]
MKLYLHIGTEKTGTSSVQNFFGNNRELLARSGVLYPESPGHRNHTALAGAAQEISNRGALRKTMNIKTNQDVEDLRARLVEGLASEYASRPFEKVVMSGEHCSSRLLTDEEVGWLKDVLTPHFEKIYIIVYLRRQDDFLLSTYSTGVKSGSERPLDIPPPAIIRDRYDYWNLVSRWARAFGKEQIICRKFERNALKSGDIVDDILDVIGIEAKPEFDRQDANESLDADTLEFLRLFNAHVPRFVEGSVNPARSNIIGLLSKFSQGPLITLGDAELREFMGYFEESNRKVAVEFFDGARSEPGDALFGPRADTRPRTPPVTLSPERAVEIAAYLWQRKQEQLDRAVERARRREGRQGDRLPGPKNSPKRAKVP